jgi:membrane peptidoglycan carboxypeptidase
MNANHLIRMRQRRRLAAKTGPAKRLTQIMIPTVVVILAVILAIPVTAAAAAAGVYSYFTQDLPDSSQIKKVETDFQTTKIYDRKGGLLYEIIDPTGGDRQWTQLNNISSYLTCATVAIEDKTFWENQGFDIRGIARAFVSNLQGGATQGGSGITQQLVKAVILPPEERAGPGRTTAVKIKEVLLSAEVTRRYEKRDILEWYLNTNFYGNLAYGIEAASRVYFNKSAKDLTLAEAAMLAPIPQFPKQNPFNNPTEAKFRQSLVLDLMVERTQFGVPGCNVTAREAAAAKVQKLVYASKTQRFAIKAPHFSVYAKDKAIEILADHLGIGVAAATSLVERGGLKIYTTLDLDIDTRAREIANEKVAALQADGKDANNASVVVIKQDTGEVLAMVGSLDYFNDNIDGKFNVATGLRQPGSSFKPITYLELLRQGASPATLFWDVRTTFDSGGEAPYVPENYDRKYHGPVLMREALARSYNIPAVDALNRAGIGNVIRLAHRLGITDLDRGLQYYGLALTLGGGEVKLLDQTYAYATIANDGTMVGAARPASQKKSGMRDLDPVVVRRVEDSKGKILYDYVPAVNPNLLGPDSAKYTYMLKSIMTDAQARAAAFGYPSVLDLSNGRPAAVKTGTTNDYRDNWTMGFTTDYTVGVWVGNTDNHPMSRGVTGLTGAAPIWHDVMEYLHANREIRGFTRPDGLVTVNVCNIDGLLSNGVCPGRNELFLPNTEPEQTSTVVQKFPINKETGKLALPGTPPEMVEEKDMYVFPPQAFDWYASLTDDEKARLPIAPTDFDTRFGGLVNAGDVAIAFPQNGGYVSAVVTQTSITPPPPPDPNIPVDPNAPPPAPVVNVLPPGIIEIRGNAKGGNWTAYKVFFAPGWSPAPEQWQQIGPDKTNQVDNNVLENWNLGGLAPGPYSLKVQRIENDGRITEATTQVTVDNTPPAVALAQPFPGEGFLIPDDEWVDVNADVRDDNTISKVEFYMNGELFATKAVAPFTVKWTIKGAGRAEFYAIAYDGAGNKTESARVAVSIGQK